MAESFHSRHPSVPFVDLFLGGKSGADQCVTVGPVPPSKRESVNESGLGEIKEYGAKSLRGEGPVRVATLGFANVRRDGSIVYPEEPTLPYGPDVHDHVVVPGDILFRNRGYAGGEKVSVAAYVGREAHDEALRQLKTPMNEGCFIHTASLFRIRLKENGQSAAPTVEPEYLAAYINSPRAQRYLTRHNQGLIVQGVTKKDLYQLPVSVPPLAEQRRLVEFLRTQAEYGRVSARISECYGLLADHFFNRS